MQFYHCKYIVGAFWWPLNRQVSIPEELQKLVSCWFLQKHIVSKELTILDAVTFLRLHPVCFQSSSQICPFSGEEWVDRVVFCTLNASTSACTALCKPALRFLTCREAPAAGVTAPLDAWCVQSVQCPFQPGKTPKCIFFLSRRVLQLT